MKKLNVYIARQITVGFLLVSFSLMSIIWLTQSLRFVELITNKGIGLGIFVQMTSLLMPRIFTILSPISLFAAILFVYNRMLSDRELIVMKAAGISPWQNAKPAIFIGFLLCLFNVYNMNILTPNSENHFKDLQWQVKNDVSHLMFREGEFTTLQNNLTVFITTHNPDGSVGGILINDERTPNLKSTISAELGRIIYTDKGPRIILVNGSRQEIAAPLQQHQGLAQGEPKAALAAKAVQLELLFQTQKGEVLPVKAQPEFFAPAKTVELFPQGAVIGIVEIEAGDPVAAVRAGVLVGGKQPAQPPGKHKILLREDLVLGFVPQPESGRGGQLSRHSRCHRNRCRRRRHSRCRRRSRSR